MACRVADRSGGRLASGWAGAALVAVLLAFSPAPFLATAALAIEAPTADAGSQPRSGNDAIVVKGNRRVDAEVIRSHFRTESGRIDDGAVNAALEELYRTGQFEDVEISRAGARLIVTVVEAPVIEGLQFEGNKYFKDKDLTPELGLKPRAPMTKPAVQSDVERIIDMYRAAGRYDVQVAPKIISRGDGRVDLIFEIKEGDKTGVKRILFVGNRNFRDSRLKGVIKTTESGWFAFLKTSDVYDPDHLESDSDLLRRFYVKNGFADARVSAAAAYEPNQKGFTVTYTIDEGDRYRYGAVDVRSHLENLDPGALRVTLPMAKGDVFNGEAVDKAVGDLAIAAGKRGFPFAAVRAHVNRNSNAKLVDLVFTIDDGPHVYVERIDIHGNTFTQEFVIRREFEIGEGDAYNRGLVDKAQKRLKGLNLFKSVKITDRPGSTTDRLVLEVEVEEKQTGNFSISGGYSTQYGPIGEITVSEANFLGLGQFVKVTATLGEYLRGGSLTYVEPYFLDTSAALGFDLFYKEALTSEYQSYGSTVYGTTVRLDTPLMDNVTSEARYSLVNQSMSLTPGLMDCSPSNPPPGCFANGEASAAVKQTVLNGAQWISSVGTTLSYSTIDNPRDPHDGIRVDVKQDVAGLGGDADFLRSTADVRYYHDFGDGIVSLTRAQGGFLLPYDGQTLPLQNSFFGGPNLVRGFAPNGFGPRDLTPGTTQDNIGGSKYWASTQEFDAPIPELPPEIALKVAVFADAGSVWGYGGQTSFPSLSPSLMQIGNSSQIRASLGAGLIWDSPFGPLRVDYAYPIAKTSYDVTQRLHFGFGGF